MITLSWDTRALMAKLTAIRTKGLKYAVSMAMTWVSKDAAEAFQGEINSKVDRPTPSTQRASMFAAANKDKTEFDLYIQDKATGLAAPSDYLRALVNGGYRKDKGFERLLKAKGILPAGWQVEPGRDMPKDQYGNLRGGGGKYQQIALGLSAYSGERASAIQTAREKRNPNMVASKQLYFVLWSMKTKTPEGIYQRRGKRKVAQIFTFTPKRARYGKVLDFKATVTRVFHATFEAHFQEGLRRMIEKVKSW